MRAVQKLEVLIYISDSTDAVVQRNNILALYFPKIHIKEIMNFDNRHSSIYA